MNKFLLLSFLILASNMFGQSIEHYEKLALASFYAKDFPTSLLYNERIIELDNKNASSLFFAGESARQLDDLMKAESYFEKIPEAAKNGYLSATDYHIGLVKHSLGKRDEAKNYYEGYLNKHYNDNDLYTHLAKKAIHSLAKGDLWVEEGSLVDKLPDNINTKNADMAPLRYADKLYFSTVLEENYLPTKNKKRSKRMVQHPVSRIYEAQFNREAKSSTVNPASVILNASNVTLMPDASRMYYTLCTDENPDSQEHCTIWFRNRFYDGKWGPAIKLPEHINNRKFTNTQPSIGYDWTLKKYVLFFVSDRPGGAGGKDIWYSVVEKDDTFSEPRSLPTNTPSDEVTPFFHQQSQTLFFSSNGWGGKGGFDIFHTAKASADLWKAPTNYGEYLNTKNDETYYTYHTSSKFAYYVSTERNGNTVETDIFEARIFVDLKVRTFDKTTKKPINAVTLEIEDVKTGATGTYTAGKDSHLCSVKLEPGSDYLVKVSVPGFQPYTMEVNTDKVSYFKLLEENIFLTPLARP